MVTKQEKQEVCIESLEKLAPYVVKLRNFEFKRNYIGSMEYELILDVSSTHSLNVTLVEPCPVNYNSGQIRLDVVSNSSNFIQHRIWLAIEPAENSAAYLGYSTPYFRGKPQELERVESISSDISTLFASRLITEGIRSDAVLNTLYLGLPKLLNEVKQLPDFRFK